METVTAEKNKIDIARQMLKTMVDRRTLASLEVCVRCGTCTESCHYYKSDPRREHAPYYRAEQLRHLYRSLVDPVGRIAPYWFGARKVSEEMLPELAKVAFATCTMCHRCTIECPFGVETAEITRILRAILTATGYAPEMLVELANAAIAKEENADMFRDIYMEQVKEIEKEVQERLGNPKAVIPVEKEGAKILYTPLAGAHTIIPQSIIFNAAGESWTMGMFEASNYATFLADPEKAKRITGRVIREAEKLKVKEIVITECGHAYSVMRWEAPKWFGGPLPFRVRSIIEVIDEYIRDGKLHPDPSKNKKSVTYHDSCNLGRKGGLFDEPRRVLRAIANDFREMTPNRLHSYCCGAGSGLVALPEWEDIRLNSGKVKADQIRQTGAEIVVTSCDNCRHQIAELGEKHQLNIQVTSLSELTINALV
jgi:Fe-S oxidoreductase